MKQAEDGRQGNLYQALLEYSGQGVYPFHMPGHKRRTEDPFLQDFPNPFSIDITEIHGFDNLHHAEGILRESMDRMAAVYGADRSYYLVNGSSSGVLSAVSAVSDNSGTILMARNCHKSAYHGVFLNRMRTAYTYPQIHGEFGVQCGLVPSEIEKLLNQNVDISAVFVVSPTYDGIVSDIKKIANLCHERKIPLVADEAHGAHFPFGSQFPASALEAGADVVIQSLHKTLPSLTQTAVLHVKEGLVDVDRLEHYLQIYQSSSPSYVFMAAMERCVSYMNGEGWRRMDAFYQRILALRRELEGMRCLRLLDASAKGTYGIYDLDLSKIVISTRKARITGEELDRRLREEAGLEMEMCTADSVTAITSLMDTEEGLNRLKEALLEADRRLEKRVPAERPAEPLPPIPAARPVMTIYEAWNRPKKPVPLEQSAGHIAGEYVYLYPPGIPILAPGEEILPQAAETMIRYKEAGLALQGLKDYRAETIQVLR